MRAHTYLWSRVPSAPGSELRSAEEPLAQEDQETRVVIGHYLSLAERLLPAEPEPSAVEEDNQAA